MTFFLIIVAVGVVLWWKRPSTRDVLTQLVDLHHRRLQNLQVASRSYEKEDYYLNFAAQLHEVEATIASIRPLIEQGKTKDCYRAIKHTHKVLRSLEELHGILMQPSISRTVKASSYHRAVHPARHHHHHHSHSHGGEHKVGSSGGSWSSGNSSSSYGSTDSGSNWGGDAGSSDASSSSSTWGGAAGSSDSDSNGSDASSSW